MKITRLFSLKIFLNTIIIIVLTSPLNLDGQIVKLRNGIFLHHSTGECIWGPNGGNTSVPEEISKYNLKNNYTGDDAVSMTELWYPDDDNEWATWDAIFRNEYQQNDIRPYLQEYKIIVIKSCFPSSNLGDWGMAADTLDPYSKTIYNYKWHWRNIINIMRQHPENFFVIWTNAPLVLNETNETESHLSNSFCTWAKDTLANGNDSIFGEFPNNVYVFDFFHKLVDNTGMLPLSYASGEYDSHPNGNATDLVAPQFVEEIFNAAILYENFTKVENYVIIKEFSLEQNYPNPFNPSTTINYSIPTSEFVTLKVFDLLGNEVSTLVNEEKNAGNYQVNFDGSKLSSGIYFYKINTGIFAQTSKMLFLK